MTVSVEVRNSAGSVLYAGTATDRLQWYIDGGNDPLRVIEDTGDTGKLIVKVL